MKDVRQIPLADIREVTTHKKAHLLLLLLGGGEEAMIDRYLARGTLYVLSIGGEDAAVCVVTEEEGALEVKNLAAMPERQRQGIGRALLRWGGAGGIGTAAGPSASARATPRPRGPSTAPAALPNADASRISP